MEEKTVQNIFLYKTLSNDFCVNTFWLLLFVAAGGGGDDELNSCPLFRAIHICCGTIILDVNI